MAEDEKTKNHPGGLSDKADAKDPKMFETKKKHCPVQYFKKYLSLLNPGEEALFQRPKRSFSSSDKIWFDKSPLGVNTLSSMMKEISKAAQLSQLYTNHSVRATSITILDRAGIPVHRIMQVSGHRNQDSVKVYCERQTLQQQQECSNVLATSTFESPETTLALAGPQSHSSPSRNDSTALVNRASNQLSYQQTHITNMDNSPKFVALDNVIFGDNCTCNFVFNYQKN